jgi:hypothetical protein
VLVALFGGNAVATGTDSEDNARPTALVIDASLGRDGRELVDPRLEGVDAEVRLPRTVYEARTNVRYFDALGYDVVVAGPEAAAASESTGVAAARVAGLDEALSVASR